VRKLLARLFGGKRAVRGCRFFELDSFIFEILSHFFEVRRVKHG
jgi:hypothetical protein